MPNFINRKSLILACPVTKCIGVLKSKEKHVIASPYLGSWHAITDEEGNLIQELSFDAWGNRCDPATWESYEGAMPATLYDRGFIPLIVLFNGKHLYGFNLINMSRPKGEHGAKRNNIRQGL